MKNTVEFYRFVRPFDYKLNHVKSDQGVTMYIVLDYATRLGIVSFAVCNGDNFNKAIGKHLARQRFYRGEVVVFSIDEFVDSGDDLRHFVYQTLKNMPPNNSGLDLIKHQMRKGL